MNIITQNTQSTVLSEYTPEPRTDTAYQTEAALEKDFINRLISQGYEYVSITNADKLVSNLRLKIEELNDFKFSDKEWEQFYSKILSNKKDSILEKTRLIQENNLQTLSLENGTFKNIKLIDTQNIHNNSIQVLNQYEEKGGTHNTRYDVTILVNGFPLVHVELKKRGVAIKEAFNQIRRYQRESFWAGCGLYEYIQIFVISNGTYTKYYSNTTRDRHIKDITSSSNKARKTSNTFEFTSYWADEKNNRIEDLVDFTKTFFVKHTLLNILTKYSIFTSEEILLVMRPYQIVATEKILNRILCSYNSGKIGTIDAGGFIWHTTGSGKTLTSFKTAQLASKLEYVDKVLFIVDRKDLDYQTMKEYDRFEKGAANSNTSTAILKKQLESNSSKIIITTIQKLSTFINKNKNHNVYKEHIVFIFDECHRSQFGEMHLNITKNFKKYNLFGFTGTPISAGNSGSGKYAHLKTTEQAFGKQLHAYTIVNAIDDKNVLPFRVDYVNTIKNAEIFDDKQIKSIDKEKALLSDDRIREIVNYILEHFDQKTYRNKSNSSYEHKTTANTLQMANSKNNTISEKQLKTKVNGFNSILAVSSIAACKKYYSEFMRQMREKNKHLNIATIFSFSPNEEENTYLDEEIETDALDVTSKEFLNKAISDYNNMFFTNYDTSADKFPSYYKDVSLRMKNREIDLLIVVNMFLTGFDATTLNTLWVDKNLRYHGLIQAFSRTNRILNSVKTFGNIVCFRNLEDATNEALMLFGDTENKGIVILKSYNDYLNGYVDDKGNEVQGYSQSIKELQNKFPLQTDNKTTHNMEGEQAKKEFINLFGSILRLKNILSSFDEFDNADIISERDMQDYQSKYIDLYNEFRDKNDNEKEDISTDVIFEIELIKQVEVNIDYILSLLHKYQQSNCKDKTIVSAINKSIDASVSLRSKKELIEQFISQINISLDVDIEKSWIQFFEAQKSYEVNTLIKEENLKVDETLNLVENIFKYGLLRTKGSNIDNILPRMSRFASNTNNARMQKKQLVTAKIHKLFEKYS
ncbi:DEAD/DEAH box helicase [Candidatus Epulonipiscium fishelsonii]|uniref:DEAD/DEAH box helicase n=1 Tax=Candidatus Epulonipiscium fishelsonii TaxID=77094 RepID=A0ACC8XFN5_9FIRM|nr:DEAD/DEAH box helicase [Epulopiscium sp. SCG-B11WGA-EpuloA1]ONI42537.1 DEAD/DEAH box helicase [Epulopiscium sp. SCG-B05WGA-EpuloA1]